MVTIPRIITADALGPLQHMFVFLGVFIPTLDYNRSKTELTLICNWCITGIYLDQNWTKIGVNLG